jgi:hypothetical protein
MITSNTPWTLKCSEPWLSANIETGEGFRQVVFTAKENIASNERKANVTVTMAGMAPRVIQVTQKSAKN